MNHRHLLPNEFDLLLDGDVGFGVAPLRLHVRGCARCRSELDALQDLALSLDDLPHFAPSARFADRVLSQVQVFEPWHVAARSSGQALVPRGMPMRVLAGAGAVGAVLVFSLLTAAVVLRLDLFIYSASLVLDRARGGALALGGELISAVLGPSAADAAAVAGGGALLMTVIVLLVAVAAGAAGFGVLTAAARRHRDVR